MLRLRSIKSSNAAPTAVWWLGALLFVALAAGLFTLTLEWEHYRQLLKYKRIALARQDRPIILWLLWAKTMLPLLPVLAGTGLLTALGRRKAAALVLNAGATLLFFFLAADLVMQTMTGNHLADFLPYLHDALLHSAHRNHRQWGGDTTNIVLRGALVLAAVVACGQSLYFGSEWAVQRLAERLACRVGYGSVAACTGLLFLATVAAVPSQAMCSQPVLLRRLHTALPIDLSLFVPYAAQPEVYARWLVGPKAADRIRPGVRIVSAVPDPVGTDEGKEEVALHNFAAVVISLDGWHLHNKGGSRFALVGSIGPGETRKIVLPENVMPLNNEGDHVNLVDSRGRQLQQAKYKANLVKYGAVVPFRDELDFDEFHFRTNQAVQAVYQHLHADLLTSRPADPNARVSAASQPNVVYLVLESFRHTAVSPALMSRLDAWGRQGLRLQRHYAGSNASHLGLFTLLYGRSPLAYHPTLDAGIEPQTCLSLRQSGYGCTFVTSGDCTGFRRMDQFLNNKVFDQVIIETGDDWRDWPERDQRSLAHVRRILSQSANKPQFVMAFLMSTHFPYAFPPQFSRHQPSGEHVDGNNWSQMDPKLLNNRYQNAAEYLEDELMRLIEGLDPARNLIVVTGDHGESMGEDGAIAHASRGSEIQLRVPFLMVGPGISPQVVERPTLHCDLLPTLLHALSGREVPIQHTHGRDLLSGQPLPEQVLLFPHRWTDPHDLLLVRGAQRMQFRIRLDSPWAEVVGFCDDSGDLELTPVSAAATDESTQWAEAFRKELLNLLK